VGSEPPPSEYGTEAVVTRGLEELERRGWDSCVIAGDEYGGYPAIHLAAGNPELVAGLALGHACLSLRGHGERAPLDGEVMSALMRLAEIDYRSFARHLSQATQDAYDDQTADAYMERVPQEAVVDYRVFVRGEDEDLEPLLRRLDRPMLLAEHDGCLGWTREGFEDAVAAFPAATTASMTVKCSASPEFAEALREFCGTLGWE